MITKYILDRLEGAGFDAYIVGGSVRDMIIGRKTSDFDIATNALPRQVAEVFEDHKVIETGLKHGTVTVLHKCRAFEITTFRTEGVYSDKRRPDEVHFTRSIEQDLRRRDFTINAIAYSEKSGVVDLFGGVEDIKNKVIRAVGDPNERFCEDYLRVLRGLRFASVLGFDIEVKTADAMAKAAPGLKHVAVERIFCELVEMAKGEYFYSVLKEYLALFLHFLPEITVPDRDFSSVDNHLYRLANMFETGELARTALRRLKADNNTVKKVVMYAKSKPLPVDTTEIKKLLKKGEESTLDICRYREEIYGEACLDRIKAVIDSGECYSLKTLAVKGEDLANQGYESADIGEGLEYLLDAVIENKLENKKSVLLKKLKERYKMDMLDTNRLGLSTNGKVFDLELFESYAKAGIKYMEISLDPPDRYNHIDYPKIKEWAEQTGVIIYSLHLPYYPFETNDISTLDDDIRVMSVGLHKGYIQQGADAGIKIFVLHPSAEPIPDIERQRRLEQAKKSIDQLCDFARDLDVYIAIEDLPRTCLGNTSEDINYLTSHPHARVCLDTNHLLTEDVGEFVRKVGSKIITTHISDFDTKNERHWQPGEGVIDWVDVMDALDEVGYAGPLMYEVRFVAPDTIVRDRDLNVWDFVNNYKSLIGRKPFEVLGKPLSNL